jgi:hypothetical protein
MSRPEEQPVKLVPFMNSHLAFVVKRASTRRMICREPLDSGEPPCERCGLLTFCLDCYIETIARSPKERRFWATTSTRVSEALTRFAIFLCPGCRS